MAAMRKFFTVIAPAWMPLALLAVALAPCQVYAEGSPDTAAAPADSTNITLGAGLERMPKWLGAKHSKNQAIPYVDIEWHDRIELSSTDGLTVDLLHSDPWHGGLVGTMMWGRSYKDLDMLAAAVPTLNNTLQAGAYLEYDFNKAIDVGLRVSHDIQSTGAAYANVYFDFGLPAPWSILHGLKFNAEFMNDSAMQRYFSVSPQAASSLGVASYQAHSGLEKTSLSYQAYVPTSQSSGLVLGATWSLLANHAADSPLVRHYGAKLQRSYMAAFTVKF